MSPAFLLIVLSSPARPADGAQEGVRYDLAWHAKVRQVFNYRLSLDIKVGDAETDIDADFVQRIRNWNATWGFDVESTTKNLRVLSDEATQTLPDQPPLMEHFDRKGRRAQPATKPEDPFATLMDAATAFRPPLAPVKVGEKWSFSEGRARADYRLVGRSKVADVPVLRVRFAYSSGGSLHGAGDFYLDARDGSLYNATVNVENARIFEGEQVGNVSVQLRRVKAD